MHVCTHDRAMLRPVLETLGEISEDRRLQMNGFRVILEFASDSHCQRIIADNLDAIMVGLAWHQRPPDQALQQAGLEILLKMVDSEELDDASLGRGCGNGVQGEQATVAATCPGKKAMANGVSRLTVGVSVIPVAVRSMQTYEARRLQLTVVRLFASLAHNEPTNRNLIVSSGGVEAVFAALRANSDDADFQTHGLKFVSEVAWSEGQIQVFLSSCTSLSLSLSPHPPSFSPSFPPFSLHQNAPFFVASGIKHCRDAGESAGGRRRVANPRRNGLLSRQQQGLPTLNPCMDNSVRSISS